MAYKLQILNAEVYCSIRIMLCLMIFWMSMEDLRLIAEIDNLTFSLSVLGDTWHLKISLTVEKAQSNCLKITIEVQVT